LLCERIRVVADGGKAGSVARECSQITGVLKADTVIGPYDVIVFAEARSVDELGKFVVARIQMVEGITRTPTCPVVNV
jgi:DNA-binding Lrp family transcriptional regulator